MLRVLLVALLLAFGTAARAEPIPAEHFGELEALLGPQISPDGTHLAARAKVGDRHILVILPLAGNGKPAVVNVGKDDVNGYRWVNDEWLIVRIGGNVHIGQEVYTTRVISVDRSAQTINKLGWKMATIDADDVIWVANDGSPRVLVGMQGSTDYDDARFWPQVFEFDVTNGKSKLALGSHKGIWNWAADSVGRVRAGWGFYHGTSTAYLVYRSSEKDDFRTIEAVDLTKKESTHYPQLLLPASDATVVVSDHEGFAAVYEFDMAASRLGKKLFGVDGYDVADVSLNDSRTELASISFTDTSPRRMWLDPELKQIEEEVVQAVGHENAYLFDWSRDRSRLLFRIGHASQAGAYYLYDRKAGSLSRLGWINPVLQDRSLAPVKTIRYEARDGLEISAILTLPEGGDAQNLPLIVFPHGGPRTRDSEGWDWIAQFLANRGYAVIQPNYRGSAGFGTAFEEMGEGEWGLKMQDDVDDAVAHLSQEGIADPGRVCVVGASYGGYVAMRAATRDGFKYRCAASYAGVSDLEEMQRYDRGFLFSKVRKDWMRRQTPDLKAVSPKFAANAAHTPLLLVHGKEDLTVPISQSREMAARLEDAGKSVVYIEQKEGDHHFSRQEDRVQFLKALESFLEQHNPI